MSWWEKDEVVSAAPKPAAPSVQRGTLEELGRQIGLTIRAGAQGASALPALLSDAVTGVVNEALDAYDEHRAPTAAEAEAGGKQKGFRFIRAQEALGRLLTAAGLPEPETRNERIAQEGAAGMMGAGTFAKAGQVLSKAGNAVVSEVGKKLATGPGLQVVSGGAGTVAPAIVRENGGGPGEQLAAGVTAALTPGFVQPAAAAAVRGIVRGGEAGRQVVADNLKLFEQAGTTPTVGQATESRGARAVESLLSRTPGGAGVMVRKAEQQADEMAAAVQKLADSLAPNASAVNAGEAILRGVQGFKNGFKQVQARLYDTLDTHIPEGTPITVSNTESALKALNADIPGAPNLSELFKNARIRGIDKALQADLDAASNGIGGAVQTAVRGDWREFVGANMGAAMKKAVADGASADKAHGVAMKALSEQWKALKAGGAQASAGEQVTSEVSGSATLPYEAIKKLRTLVGNEIADASLVSDVPRSKWMPLYAALSEDLGVAAQKAGPQAEQAWQWANQFTKTQLGRLEELSGLVGRDAPEKVFMAAISGTAEGDTIARRVISAIPKSERREFAAAMLQRLGRATPGQQNAEGDAFSSQTFLTNLAKLSKDARQTIFGRTDDKGILAQVENMGKVAENFREGSKVFANPSGTAQALSLRDTMLIGGGAAATGNVGTAGLAVGAPVLANGVARVMTSPGFVKKLAEPTTLPAGALASTVEAAGRTQTAEQPQWWAADEMVQPATTAAAPAAQSVAPAGGAAVTQPAAPSPTPAPVAPQPRASAAPADPIAAIGAAQTVDEAIAAAGAAVDALPEPQQPPEEVAAAPEPAPQVQAAAPIEPQQVAQAGLMDQQPAGREAPGGGPVSTWHGRRGAGYLTASDALNALPSRQKAEPDLEWRLEEMPNKHFRLAGYARPEQPGLMAASGGVQMRALPGGNAVLTGDDQALQQFMRDRGITSFARAPGGYIVGRSQAQLAAA